MTSLLVFRHTFAYSSLTTLLCFFSTLVRNPGPWYEMVCTRSFRCQNVKVFGRKKHEKCVSDHTLCVICVIVVCAANPHEISWSLKIKKLCKSQCGLASHSVIITLADCTLVIHGIQEESEDGKIIIFLFDPFHISNNSSLISARQLLPFQHSFLYNFLSSKICHSKHCNLF